jgi:serine/threonine-protein kinase
LAQESTVPETISHYRVIRKLGSGGMGEVYLVEDTKLRRKAALKILSLELTRNEGQLHRFEQEAIATSALNHPNILTIYEVGSEEGKHFIATEYIEGETLRERLGRNRMAVSEILDASIQIASAMASAHQAGIIHRDIKPENIMVRTDGYVKVLDFGIAKLTESFSAHQPESGADATVVLAHTEPGVVIGTPHYMSPEQTRGSKVDLRADIFSLGVVMYEMVTGQRPFAGSTPVEVIVSILEKTPPPLTEQSPDVPAELQRIVSKAMAKDTGSRYQSAEDLLADLKSLKAQWDSSVGLNRAAGATAATPAGSGHNSGGAAVTTPMQAPFTTSSAEYLLTEIRRHKKGVLLALAALLIAAAGLGYFTFSGHERIESLAILPFVNVGGDAEGEYLSDGVTDSLINSLSQLPGLEVMSHYSVFKYKGGDQDPHVVGRELGVHAVLTGRIVQRGDSITISTELVDARHNTHIWGDREVWKLTRIAAAEETIAKVISEKLRLRLSGDQEKRMSKPHTENPEADQLYMKGRFYWNRRSPDDLRKGIECFNQAIEKDPTYAPAYAGLADSYNIQARLAGSDSKDLVQKAKAAAIKALELDDTAEAHTSLGDIKSNYEWDWAGAEREFLRAIALNPNYATAHQWYAALLVMTGRTDEALREIQRAQELDPLSPIITAASAGIYFYGRQYDRAVEQVAKTRELDSSFPLTPLIAGWCYTEKRMYAQAIDEYQKRLGAGRIQSAAMAGLAITKALSGRTDEARKLLGDLVEQYNQNRTGPCDVALVYTYLGDKDTAFVWLDKAYDQHDPGLYRIKADPFYDPLRDDARFKDLLGRVGLPQ